MLNSVTQDKSGSRSAGPNPISFAPSLMALGPSRLRWPTFQHWVMRIIMVGLVSTSLAAQQPPDVEEKNYFGETALMRASQRGDVAAVNNLIRAGANVNAKDNSGMTALLKATNIEVLRTLIQARADVNARDNAYGWTALMWSTNFGRAAVAQGLIAGGADVDATDGQGRTALVHAAYLGRTEIVETLIKAKADVNLTTNEGTSALSFAAWGCHADVVRDLMRAGAKIGTVEWRKQQPPQFEDFPVRDFYKGSPAAVDLRSNPLARTYRTRLREGAKKGPNFAGHYSVVDWGCGSNCQVFAVVDARTGKVYQTNGGERGASFTVRSSLFIGDPPDPPNGRAYADDPVESLPARYYAWRNNKFILIYEQACSVVDGGQKCGCEEVRHLMYELPTK